MSTCYDSQNSTFSPILDRMKYGEVLELFVPSALAIDRYITPLWYALGIPGNIISARIWFLKRVRSRNLSALYFGSLAISDAFFLLIHFIFELKYAWKLSTLDIQGVCQAMHFIYMVPQYFKSLLVLAFTVERFISVCHPFECEKFCTQSRTKKIVGGVLGISVILGAPQAYFWTFYYVSGDCRVRNVEMLFQKQTFYSKWTWVTEMIINGALPLIVLVLNISVLREIRQISRRNSFSIEPIPAARSNARTMTLIWISFYHIGTTLPVTIVFALHTIISIGNLCMMNDEISQDVTWQRYFSYITGRRMIEEIGLSRHACNIFIYGSTGRQFRIEMKTIGCLILNLFSKWCPKCRTEKRNSNRKECLQLDVQMRLSGNGD